MKKLVWIEHVREGQSNLHDVVLRLANMAEQFESIGMSGTGRILTDITGEIIRADENINLGIKGYTDSVQAYFGGDNENQS